MRRLVVAPRGEVRGVRGVTLRRGNPSPRCSLGRRARAPACWQARSWAPACKRLQRGARVSQAAVERTRAVDRGGAPAVYRRSIAVWAECPAWAEASQRSPRSASVIVTPRRATDRFRRGKRVSGQASAARHRPRTERPRHELGRPSWVGGSVAPSRAALDTAGAVVTSSVVDDEPPVGRALRSHSIHSRPAKEICVTADRPRYAAEDLRRFVTEVFVRLDVPPEDARVGAETLVHADLLGIDSHGVAHVARHPGYVVGLRGGSVNPRPQVRVLRETPSTVVLDGDGGLGVAVAPRAMARALDKAADGRLRLRRSPQQPSHRRRGPLLAHGARPGHGRHRDV